jgi:hypothetical protein
LRGRVAAAAISPRIRKARILAILLAAIAWPATADVLSPFEAHYEVERGSMGLGATVFSLQTNGDCYRYRGKARPNALVSLFVGDVSDESRFCMTDDGRVAPRRFEHIESRDDEDSHSLVFGDDDRVIYRSRAGQARTFAAPEDALEPFVIHIAVRLWIDGAEQPALLPNRTFTVVDEDEIKHYQLAVREGGRLETPAGTWDTLVVERVDDPNRQLRFWLAPELSWLPIKVEHQKGDDPVIRMTLEKLPQRP